MSGPRVGRGPWVGLPGRGRFPSKLVSGRVVESESLGQLVGVGFGARPGEGPVVGVVVVVELVVVRGVVLVSRFVLRRGGGGPRNEGAGVW